MMTNRLKRNQCFSSQAVRQFDRQNWRSTLNVFVRTVPGERTFLVQFGRLWLAVGAADEPTRHDDWWANWTSKDRFGLI
jgi:hypothetical protein